MSPIICPACLQFLGSGTAAIAPAYAAAHASQCPATDAEHAQAVSRMRQGASSYDADQVRQKFNQIVGGLNL